MMKSLLVSEMRLRTVQLLLHWFYVAAVYIVHLSNQTFWGLFHENSPCLQRSCFITYKYTQSHLRGAENKQKFVIVGSSRERGPTFHWGQRGDLGPLLTMMKYSSSLLLHWFSWSCLSCSFIRCRVIQSINHTIQGFLLPVLSPGFLPFCEWKQNTYSKNCAFKLCLFFRTVAQDVTVLSSNMCPV